MVSYILYRVGAALARLFPRRIAKGVAAVVAFSFFVCRPGIRANVARNFRAMGMRLRSTFPVFYHFSHAVTDFLRLSFMAPEELASICRIEGREHLDDALRAGRGAILFAPHLGPWELAGAYLPTLGYRLNTVAHEHPSDRVTRFFSAVRRRWGLTDFPVRWSARELVGALARGEIVVLLVDRSYGRGGVKLRFFGTETVVPVAHVVLSRRSGAPLVPCCCYYVARERIVVSIGEPITPSEHVSEMDAASACLERIEASVRAHADQWFAFDNLWLEENDA